MAFHSRHRGDITIQGIAIAGENGMRWDRILLAAGGMPAVHLGPATGGDEPTTTTPSGHAEPTLTAPIDADSAPADDAGGAVPNLTPPADTADPAGASAPDPFRHPPYFAPEPLHDSSPDPSAAPGDPAPPAGLIPKGEALIWSGPAIIVFPGDAHDTAGDAANPDSNSAGTADLSAIPDAAETPGGVTRADLDPVLAAMGSGADHAAPAESGGTDLSAAFLPPDSSDPAHLPHGLDPGFALTPQPMPPPPDIIG